MVAMSGCTKEEIADNLETTSDYFEKGADVLDTTATALDVIKMADASDIAEATSDVLDCTAVLLDEVADYIDGE